MTKILLKEVNHRGEVTIFLAGSNRTRMISSYTYGQIWNNLGNYFFNLVIYAVKSKWNIQNEKNS